MPRRPLAAPGGKRGGGQPLVRTAGAGAEEGTRASPPGGARACGGGIVRHEELGPLQEVRHLEAPSRGPACKGVDVRPPLVDVDPTGLVLPVDRVERVIQCGLEKRPRHICAAGRAHARHRFDARVMERDWAERVAREGGAARGFEYGDHGHGRGGAPGLAGRGLMGARRSGREHRSVVLDVETQGDRVLEGAADAGLPGRLGFVEQEFGVLSGEPDAALL